MILSPAPSVEPLSVQVTLGPCTSDGRLTLDTPEEMVLVHGGCLIYSKMNTYSFKPERACVASGLEQPQGWNRGGFSTGDLSSQIP